MLANNETVMKEMERRGPPDYAARCSVDSFPARFDLRRVEEERGAGPTGSRPFPFPARQTGRAHFEHPAFRQRPTRYDIEQRKLVTEDFSVIEC
jgi:hypothetical protein